MRLRLSKMFVPAVLLCFAWCNGREPAARADPCWKNEHYKSSILGLWVYDSGNFEILPSKGGSWANPEISILTDIIVFSVDANQCVFKGYGRTRADPSEPFVDGTWNIEDDHQLRFTAKGGVMPFDDIKGDVVLQLRITNLSKDNLRVESLGSPPMYSLYGRNPLIENFFKAGVGLQPPADHE